MEVDTKIHAKNMDDTDHKERFYWFVSHVGVGTSSHAFYSSANPHFVVSEFIHALGEKAAIVNFKEIDSGTYYANGGK